MSVSWMRVPAAWYSLGRCGTPRSCARGSSFVPHPIPAAPENLSTAVRAESPSTAVKVGSPSKAARVGRAVCFETAESCEIGYYG